MSRDLESLTEQEPWASFREETSLDIFPGGHRSVLIARTNKGVNKGIFLYDIKRFYSSPASCQLSPNLLQEFPGFTPEYGLEKVPPCGQTSLGKNSRVGDSDNKGQGLPAG